MSRAAKLFFALYLLIHLLVPLGGAVLAWGTGNEIGFSWQMFSRIPPPDE